MFRTFGLLFVVLVVGTVAMAWSQGPARKEATSLTINPYEVHLKAKPMAVQESHDHGFVFTN
jgi:hypothetical protein